MPPDAPDRSQQFTTIPSSLASRGVMVGPFRLLQMLGSGGMGEVWLAEQLRPVHRTVAIKVIKSGMDSSQVIARFEAERQALALMSHPAIAAVLDGGTTPDNRPYFAMEYVKGEPITTYCDRHRLGMQARLALFLQVCEGVQHAHQKGVIHRDLKPSNVLVAIVDNRPVPKIIDFGLAKAMAQSLTERTLLTELGVLMGTPEYMSPEQAEMGALDIDTRTDVYALGVMLYELLTGALPFDGAVLRKAGIEGIRRVIRESEPPRPSSRVTHLGTDSAVIAKNRDTDPRGLARDLRGDLDWIVMKTLEKDRTRRYSAASDLIADVQRYLEFQPVLAGPPRAVYRVRKFVRRHRLGVAATAAVVASLAIGVAVSTREAIAARRADQTAQAVNDFLRTDLLAQASAANQLEPSARPDPDLKVRTALDRAASRIGGKFDRQPVIEAAIRDTIGQTYADLGIYPEARAQLSRARELRQQSQGDDSPETLRTTSHLGDVAFRQGKYPEAEALFTRALEKQRRIVGPEQPDTLYSMHGLASVYYSEGKYSQAETLGSQTLSIQRRVLGSEHPDTLHSMSSLSTIYYLEGKYAEAQALGEQTLALDRRVRGPEHPDTMSMMSNLAVDYFIAGKYPQAEALYRESLELERRVLGPEHEHTLNTIQNLADVYGVQGRYAESEQLFSETLEIQRRVLGSDHSDTLHAMANLADAYYLLGKYTEAEALFRETLDAMRRVLGPDHPRTLLVLSDVAQMYQRQGRYARAEAYASQALDGRKRVFGANHASTIASEADLALADVSQGKFAESEALARDALQFFRAKQPDDWQTFFAQSVLGASVAGLGRYAEAEPLLLDGYRGMVDRKDRIIVPYLYYLDRAGEWVVQLYEKWGDRDQAAQWRTRVSAARTDRQHR